MFFEGVIEKVEQKFATVKYSSMQKLVKLENLHQRSLDNK